MMIRAHTY